ncbi:MAG: SDR family oxidoreductase [Planctomycetes bacterium]|nr:SDR family oxidoreductase [Planctomycetota bacterium]MCB9902942.1 SDR family oxidoreductase [Planctomycetota bacterium]
MSLYLVTGGAGFIGSHLVDALLARGDRVRVLDDLSTGVAENLAPHQPGEVGSGAAVEWLRGSIADAEACLAACAGVTGVFHEAAEVSVPKSVAEPRKSYEVNALGTLNVLEAMRASGAQKLVFAASSAAYGDGPELPKREEQTPSPLSPYAAGKLAGEHLLKVWAEVYRLHTVALRYFNVFGPRQRDDSPYTGVIAIFARALLEGRAPTIFGDGEQTRDFTFVENVVAANLAAMDAEGASGRVYNIGGGERISLNQLFRAMAEVLGSELEPVYAPARTGDVLHSQASVERAVRELGWRPTVDWREGLERTLDWYRAGH